MVTNCAVSFSMLGRYSSCSVREKTRCRPRGRSSDCPGLSLFPRRKAFWVATCTCAKHKPRWGRDWAAGRLLSRQPALRHLPHESSASKRALPSPVVLPGFQRPTNRTGSAYLGCCAQETQNKPGVVSLLQVGQRNFSGYLGTSCTGGRGLEYLHDHTVVSAPAACAFRVKWTRESACCSLQPRLSPFELRRAKAFRLLPAPVPPTAVSPAPFLPALLTTTEVLTLPFLSLTNGTAQMLSRIRPHCIRTFRVYRRRHATNTLPSAQR